MAGRFPASRAAPAAVTDPRSDGQGRPGTARDEHEQLRATPDDGPRDDGPRDDGLDGAHTDLASTFPPAAAPSLEHGYAWRCGGDDASGCAEAHSGRADRTDSGIEVCPVHDIRLEYRLN